MILIFAEGLVVFVKPVAVESMFQKGCNQCLEKRPSYPDAKSWSMKEHKQQKTHVDYMLELERQGARTSISSKAKVYYVIKI